MRLFDKGEMNTYRDDLSFAYLASTHLHQLLSDAAEKSGTRKTTADVERFDEFVLTKQADIQALYVAKLEAWPAEADKNSMTNGGSYLEELQRLHLARTALGCEKKMLDQCLVHKEKVFVTKLARKVEYPPIMYVVFGTNEVSTEIL